MARALEDQRRDVGQPESMLRTPLSLAIETWETEGGASRGPRVELIGSPGQVEWAERIKLQVDNEFDRVARSFQAVAAKQSGEKRADTEAILAILEDGRAAVMSRRDAGYFIKDWQEIGDQVRQMIARDSRYQAIDSNRPSRRPRV